MGDHVFDDKLDNNLTPNFEDLHESDEDDGHNVETDVVATPTIWSFSNREREDRKKFCDDFVAMKWNEYQ